MSADSRLTFPAPSSYAPETRAPRSAPAAKEKSEEDPGESFSAYLDRRAAETQERAAPKPEQTSEAPARAKENPSAGHAEKRAANERAEKPDAAQSKGQSEPPAEGAKPQKAAAQTANAANTAQAALGETVQKNTSPASAGKGQAGHETGTLPAAPGAGAAQAKNPDPAPAGSLQGSANTARAADAWTSSFAGTAEGKAEGPQTSAREASLPAAPLHGGKEAGARTNEKKEGSGNTHTAKGELASATGQAGAKEAAQEAAKELSGTGKTPSGPQPAGAPQTQSATASLFSDTGRSGTSESAPSPSPTASTAGEAAQRLAQLSPAQAGAAHAPRPVQQLADGLIQAVRHGQDKLTLQLFPEELGSIDVTLEMQNGRLKIVVAAERPETLQQLQQNQRDLERALADAGFERGSADLSFSERGAQGGEREPGTSRQAFSLNNAFGDAASEESPQLLSLDGGIDLRL
jgi:flagellar hook-length control protein FliK